MLTNRGKILLNFHFFITKFLNIFNNKDFFHENNYNLLIWNIQTIQCKYNSPYSKINI